MPLSSYFLFHLNLHLDRRGFLAAIALLSHFNACVTTPLFAIACAVHLAKRKESLCSFFLRRIVKDIAQEEKKTDAISSYSTAVFHSNNNE